LLLDSDGMKLSKRDGSTTIRALREAGVTQDEVLVLAGKFGSR
jgi:glutamyl/glutaminyl-tRNA synthetase